jgi:hypothetical protein
MVKYACKLSLLCLLLSLNGSCQNKVADPKLILGRCAQVMGSPHAPFDLIAQGYVERSDSGTSAPIRIKTKGLESFRSEMGEGEQLTVAVIHQRRGAHNANGQRTVLSRHTTAYFRADHLPALMCAMPRADSAMQVTYEGEDLVADRPVFHLKFSAIPKGKDARADAIESVISEHHVFIDQQSFVILKTSKFVFSPEAVENRSLWETVYSDYRKVKGVLMPFRLDTLVAGQKFNSTVFTTMTGDVVLSSQDFAEGR